MNPQHAEALQTIMRMADAAKEPCGMDPESPAAIRNGKLASIAQVAAQGLGLVRGPSLSALAAPHAGAAPDGWKLVPVEPTPEMAAAYDTACFSDYWREEGYAAMLAASPAAPAPCAMVGLTEDELVQCIAAAGCFGTIKISYDSGPYEITRPSPNATRLSEAITRAFCQKNNVELKDQP